MSWPYHPHLTKLLTLLSHLFLVRAYHMPGIELVTKGILSVEDMVVITLLIELTLHF